MLDVKMSVSRPWRTSPLKYDANGPLPVFLSFCRAIYLRKYRLRMLYVYALYPPVGRKCTRLSCGTRKVSTNPGLHQRGMTDQYADVPEQ